MQNTTSIKVPKKYESMLRIVEKDGDGYWAYSENGFYFKDMGCHTAHEDTQQELLKMIRTVEPCDCDECKKEIAKQEGDESFWKDNATCDGCGKVISYSTYVDQGGKCKVCK